MSAARLPYDVDFARRQTDNGIVHVYIVDANGRKIAAVWGKDNERLETAQLLVDAANRCMTEPAYKALFLKR